METLIILIPVKFLDARKVCEDIQNDEFETTLQIRELLNKKLGIDDVEENELDEDEINQVPFIYSMNDFMDEVNDQIIDNLEGYFISYVKVK